MGWRDKRDDDWEWIEGKTGWFIYEEQERIAIVIESGGTLRQAADIAAEQVGSGSWAVTAKLR
jgi:hypothetical protein